MLKIMKRVVQMIAKLEEGATLMGSAGLGMFLVRFSGGDYLWGHLVCAQIGHTIAVERKLVGDFNRRFAAGEIDQPR